MPIHPGTFIGSQSRSEKRPFDFYDTPLQFCKWGVSLLPADFTPNRILDPGAGKGRWGTACRQRWPDAFIIGCDINPDHPPMASYDDWFLGDFLEINWEPVDLVIGNFPYTVDKQPLAEMFTLRGLELLNPGGWLTALYKLEFAGSNGRNRNLFKPHPPVEIVVPLPSRIPFDKGTTNTNTIDYSIYTWKQGFKGETRMRWADEDWRQFGMPVQLELI